MININLLPDEYRKVRRTSYKAMAAVAAFVAIDATLVAWWAWTAFGVQAEVQVLLNVAQADADTQRPQVEYYRALERESREFASRESTLETITAQRISWTEKVDQLIDVVHRGGDGEKYLVWLDDLNVIQKIDTKSGTLGTLRADAHSGGPHIAHMANFLDDLASSEFARGLQTPKAPQGRLSDREVEFIPAENWAFPLEFQIQAPPAKKPAPKAKASSARAKK